MCNEFALLTDEPSIIRNSYWLRGPTRIGIAFRVLTSARSFLVSQTMPRDSRSRFSAESRIESAWRSDGTGADPDWNLRDGWRREENARAYRIWRWWSSMAMVDWPTITGPKPWRRFDQPSGDLGQHWQLRAGSTR